MKSLRHIVLIVLPFTLTGGLIFPAAAAADLPKRKPGLWEMKFEGGMAGAAAGGFGMQACVGEAQDNILDSSGKGKDFRKNCSKMEVSQSGGKTVVDAVCKADDKTTVTSHAVITGDMSSGYRMEADTSFDPPMHGVAKNHMVTTAKWLGPCKPGQSPGDAVMSGMPGMEGGLKIDAEMMKKMMKQHE